jgi:hypothetical protein
MERSWQCNVSCFDLLPEDLLEKILVTSGSWKNTVRLQAVCRSWQRCILSLDKLDFTLDSSDDEQHMRGFVKQTDGTAVGLRVTVRASKVLTPEGVAELLSKLPLLKSIYIGGWVEKLDGAHLFESLSLCPDIEQLTLQGALLKFHPALFSSPMGPFQKLLTLEIHRVVGLTDEMLARLLKSCPVLRSLSVDVKSSRLLEPTISMPTLRKLLFRAKGWGVEGLTLETPNLHDACIKAKCLMSTLSIRAPLLRTLKIRATTIPLTNINFLELSAVQTLCLGGMFKWHQVETLITTFGSSLKELDLNLSLTGGVSKQRPSSFSSFLQLLWSAQLESIQIGGKLFEHIPYTPKCPGQAQGMTPGTVKVATVFVGGQAVGEVSKLAFFLAKSPALKCLRVCVSADDEDFTVNDTVKEKLTSLAAAFPCVRIERNIVIDEWSDEQQLLLQRAFPF